MTERYLEEFEAGQTFPSGRIRVDAGRLKSFAAEFDPQPFARVHFRCNATFSFRSTPCTRKTVFTKSTPTRISFMVDASSPLTGR